MLLDKDIMFALYAVQLCVCMQQVLNHAIALSSRHSAPKPAV